jgi:phosphoenolpyruvate synthase/pyruvate phosphate dikinase
MRRKVAWQRLVKRRAPLLTTSTLFEGCTKDIEKYIGVSLNTNMVAGGKIHQVSADKKKIARIGKRVFEKTVKEPDFVGKHSQDCYRACRNLIKVAKKVSSGDLKKLASDELLKRFVECQRTFKHFAIFMYIPHGVESTIGAKAKKLFEKSNVDSVSLADLLFPSKTLESTQEQIALVTLAKEIKEGNVDNPTRKLKAHYKKYRWITMSALHDKPAEFEYFRKRLENLLSESVQEKFEEFEKNELSKKKADKLVKEKLSGQLFYLVSMLREYVFLRSYRGEMMAKFHFHLRPFLREIARRKGLTVTQLTFLTNKEVLACLKGKQLPSKDKIKKRVKSYALVEIEGKYELFSGTDRVKEIIDREMKAAEVSDVTEFKGVVANLGKAKGHARVVMDVEDVGTLKKGEILIAIMTKPDYVIAMEKSAAIVTDEGGILSHAAIVSREMNIPCVIGTKIATKVLETGDLVEVDAKKGVVRKISKAPNRH